MTHSAHAVDDYLELLLAGAPAAETPPDGEAAPPAPAPRTDPVPAPTRIVETRPPPAIAPAPPSPTTRARPERVPPPSPAPTSALASRAEEAAHDAPTTAPRASDRRARWLRLRCGRQIYALELLCIREVVLPSPLLPLRGAAPAVAGVMNLRGQVVPVIDLGLQLGEGIVEDGPETRIVVLDDQGEVLGLRVSAVEDVVLVEDAQIEDARSSRLAPVGDQRIRGIARMLGTVVLLLDAGRLLRMPLHPGS